MTMDNVIQAITSHANPKIKAIKALELRKKRKETNLFVAEGLKVIATAQECGWHPKTLVFEEGTAERGIARQLVDWALSKNAEVLQVPYDIMGKLSNRDNAQPMLATFEQRERGLPSEAYGLWIGLEEVRDPGNLGTIIRTADAAGAKGVILIGTCCDLYSQEVVRSTMGSIFAMPVARTSREDLIPWIKDIWQNPVIATHLKGHENYRRDYEPNPHLLLMGSEGPGLSDELTKLASLTVKIPMRGKADSLNLAVATALVTYEILK